MTITPIGPAAVLNPEERQTERDRINDTLMSFEQQQEALRLFKSRCIQRMQSLATEDMKRRYWAEMVDQMCSRNPYFFLTRYGYTFNPKADSRESKVQKFPRGRYIWLLCKLFYENPLMVLYLVKSRRTLISWLCVGLYLWLAMYRPGEQIVFSAPTVQQAGFGPTESSEYDYLLGRVMTIYEYLPEFLKLRHPVRESRQRERPAIVFLHWDEKHQKVVTSVIKVLPTGGAKVRGLTATAALVDEVVEHPDPEDVAQAILPSIVDGQYGRAIFTGTSSKKETAKGKEWFKAQVYGNPDEEALYDPWVELMPYEDCYDEATDPRLSDILADKSDKILHDRMMVRRLTRNTMAMQLYFTAHPDRGKHYLEFEAKQAVNNDAVRLAQEYYCDLEISATQVPMWQANPYCFTDIEYDPDQPEPEVHRVVDFGYHGACVWIQKRRKLPNGNPAPKNSYQVNIFAELDFYGKTYQLGQAILDRHEAVFPLDRYPGMQPHNLPIRDWADTAGNQGSALSDYTHMQVLVNELRKREPMVQTPGNRRFYGNEGINEVAKKSQEVLGYMPDGTPIMGVAIHTRCRVIRQIFRGAGKLDPKTSAVMHGGTNERCEHIMNTIQYWFAEHVKIADILTPADLGEKPPDAPPPMTPEELKRASDIAWEKDVEARRQADEEDDDPEYEEVNE